MSGTLVIKIDGLYLLTKPDDKMAGMSEKDLREFMEDYFHDIKMNKLKKLEKDLRSNHSDSVPTGIIQRLIDNMHVRYEDKITNPEVF